VSKIHFYRFLALILVATCWSEALFGAEVGDVRPVANWNEPDRFDLNGEKINAHGGWEFLLISPKLILKQQLDKCQDLGIAGDLAAQKRCEKITNNAYVYLREAAYTSELSAEPWAICGRRWRFDMELGARCIAAATEICKMDANGRLANYPTCMRIMGDGGWAANPSARALNFNQ